MQKKHKRTQILNTNEEKAEDGHMRYANVQKEERMEVDRGMFASQQLILTNIVVDAAAMTTNPQPTQETCDILACLNR